MDALHDNNQLSTKGSPLFPILSWQLIDHHTIWHSCMIKILKKYHWRYSLSTFIQKHHCLSNENGKATTHLTINMQVQWITPLLPRKSYHNCNMTSKSKHKAITPIQTPWVHFSDSEHQLVFFALQCRPWLCIVFPTHDPTTRQLIITHSNMEYKPRLEALYNPKESLTKLDKEID